MTVSSTSSRVVYQGNGATTVFPFAFKVQQAADLIVVYTDATGTDTVLSQSQYAATGFGLDAGGTVTYPISGSPIAAATTLTIYRDVAPTQPTSISNQGAMWPQVIEAALDRLTFIAQKITDTASRALVVSATDGGTVNALPPKIQRANAYLAFDNNGQPIAAQNVGTTTVSSWLAANFLTMTSRLAALTALGGAGTADNNALTGTNDFTAGRIKVPTRAAGDSGTDAASTAFVRNNAIRSYLAGLTLSTAGGSPTFGIAAGCAADNTNISMMTLPAAFTKTTAAWAAGSGNGAIDTGTIANNSWYHVYLIQRLDTGATDVAISTNASAPTLPAAYTLYRRIGAMLTDSSGRWVAFSQSGDEVLWLSPPIDVSAAALGTTSTLYALSVPNGVVVNALTRVSVIGAGNVSILIQSPAENVQAVSTQGAGASLTVVNGSSGNGAAGHFIVRTNGLQQIRIVASTGGVQLSVVTDGWVDRRGRDA
ncbi:hypothetical protein SAMN02745126_05961 [Enhydrobacter aerosaccus]|uniref:Phage T7 tail fibre protein n=1 Tax=Enhydrobacter aerosaccus TaxID=225324 RepID=A0A1T4TCD0_9HYPH|nr:hypothetical protein [Enhydrobacter aerosaccus]SKA37808.1 hypothetical protein SAMN02745126_05961 [Enhydrobacter aerosaccus]